MAHCYIKIIVSVLCDWLGADAATLMATELEDFADDKLNIIDPNGTPIKEVNGGLEAELEIFPNPIAEQLQFKLSSNKAQTLQMSAVDVSGKIVMNKELQILQGSNQLSFDFSKFASGVYVLNVASKKGQISRQFVKR